MGPRTARITAADFLTPPEFRESSLAEHASGQVGGVSLGLVRSGERTVMGPCYQQTPLRVFPPFHFEGEAPALVYLVNPTAGLMDGDGHLVEIVAGVGTRSIVTGQSATRVHPALTRHATQQWRLRLEPDARMVVLPGPNIPFRGARYHQRATIELAPDSQAIWADIWTPGRYARNAADAESYDFAMIVQELEVRRAGSLVYRDRFRWDGPWSEAVRRWQLGGGDHVGFASLFATGPIDLPETRSTRAVLPLASGDTLVRWLGPIEGLIREVVSTALGIAAGWPGGSAERWLLGSRHLGPTHWFTTSD